jgi:hypothetical protein
MAAEASVNSVEEYLAAVPDARKPIIDFMHDFIQQVVPGFEPHFAHNMLGYGEYEYLDSRTKKPKSWPIVALANQKQYVSLYVCATKDNRYLPEQYADSLGKVNVGKSCIRFKRIEDLNLDVLKKLLLETKHWPGTVSQ